MKHLFASFSLLALVLWPAVVSVGADYESVPTDPANICPMLPGKALPPMIVKTGSGEDVDLAAILEGKPSILVFYRGGWCPFCRRHLAELATLIPELIEMGYQVVAVSPDRPAKVGAAEAAGDHSYRLLSDSPMTAAIAMGLAFRVEDTLVEKYRNSYGIDLEADSGQTHHLLPVPAAYVIGADRTIRFAYVNPDYKTRVNGDVLRAAAKAALQPRDP